MHWFLEQVKDYYPDVIEQALAEPRIAEDYEIAQMSGYGRCFKRQMALLFHFIEYGGVFFWDMDDRNDIPEQANVKSGFLLYTSGTTGTPKLAVYSFDQFLEKFRGVSHNPVKTIMVMDLTHIGGMDVFFSVVARGGELIFPEEVTPACICRLIQDHHIEFLSLSPSFLNLILLAEAHRTYDLSSLKTVNFGAEVMPSNLLARLETAFPNVQFKQTFGTTETGTMVVERHPDNPLLIKIPNSKIVDSRLFIKSTHGMVGYLDGSSPLEDGYFPTGDLVEEHGDYIRILGRDCDSINIGGEKVLLTEVENILLSVPYVKDVKVTSQKNVILGNILVAEVVWDSALDCKKYIRDYLCSRVEKHRIPTKIKVVDSIACSERLKKVRL